MSYVLRLRCARCGEEYGPDEGVCMCRRGDDGRLDIFYDYEALGEALSDIGERSGPRNVWRYRELLPVSSPKAMITIGEGGTPLVRAGRLAEKLGLENLYLKNETVNPTGSFKDRSMAVGVGKALEFGSETTVTASSGNAAAALAAYSARAGLSCYAFVPHAASQEKVAQLLLYGAEVFRVEEREKGVDPTVEMLRLAVRDFGWYPCPAFGPFNPYQVEGPKTIAYELAEEMGWESPDWVFVPVGAACLLTGVWRGFRDLVELGLVERMPRLVGVQSSGNAPFARAYRSGAKPFEIRPWEETSTVASGLADPYPWDGDAGLRAVGETGGFAEEVSDGLIVDAERMLASLEGVFAEPSGAAGLAGLMRLRERGAVGKAESVVVLVTGSGFKDLGVVGTMVGEAPVIGPSLEELKRYL